MKTLMSLLAVLLLSIAVFAAEELAPISQENLAALKAHIADRDAYTAEISKPLSKRVREYPSGYSISLDESLALATPTPTVGSVGHFACTKVKERPNLTYSRRPFEVVSILGDSTVLAARDGVYFLLQNVAPSIKQDSPLGLDLVCQYYHVVGVTTHPLAGDGKAMVIIMQRIDLSALK